MATRFFEPNERSRCLFTPTSWCNPFNHQMPSGPLDFFCDIEAQWVAVVLPSPEGADGELWDRIFQRIRDVWEDRRIGFQCARVEPAALTEEQPCGACDLVRRAQVVIVDVNGGDPRAASFREMAAASREVSFQLKANSPGPTPIPYKKVILISDGDPGLPPFIERLFDLVDYSGADGEPDLAKLTERMEAIARDPEMFTQEETIVFDEEEVAPPKAPGDPPPATGNEPSRRPEPADEPLPDDAIQILDESPVDRPRTTAQGAPEREFRQAVDMLTETVLGLEERPNPLKRAEELFGAKEYLQALRILEGAGELHDPNLESKRQAQVADCLDALPAREVVSHFFATTSSKNQGRLKLGEWHGGRVAEAQLKLEDIDLRDRFRASSIPLYLFDRLEGSDLQPLYDGLSSGSDPVPAAILLSDQEGDDIPVDLEIARFQEDPRPVHFFVLRLPELKRLIREAGDGLGYFLKRVEDHFNTKTNFYSQGLHRVVSEDGEFFGRTRLVRELVSRLKSGDSFAVLGLRRSGKTSLLRRLERVNQLASHLIVIVDVEAAAPTRIEHLYYYIAKKLRRAVEEKYPPTTFQIDRFPALDLDSYELFTLDPNAPQSDYLRCFTDSLEGLMASLQKSPDLGFEKLMLIFDEIENILPGSPARPDGLEEYRDFLGQIRALNQAQNGFMFAMVGFGPLLLREQASHGAPLFSQIDLLPLGMLSETECNELVETIGRKMKVYYKPESLSEIYQLSGGDPRWTKFLCSEIFKERGSTSGWVSPEDVLAGLARFLRSERTQHRLGGILEALEDLCPLEAQILSCLARKVALGRPAGAEDLRRWLIEEGALGTSATAEGLRRGPGASDGLLVALDRLCDYSLLGRASDDAYRFRIGMLHHWILEDLEG